MSRRQTVLIGLTVLVLLGTLSAGAANGERLVIGSVIQPMQNPWVVNNIRFQRAVADALGVELIVVTDDNSEEKHVAAVESLIARGVDGLIVDALTSAAGQRALLLAEEHRVPLVAVDRIIVDDMAAYPGEYLIAQAGQNTHTWGYRMMKRLIDGGATKIAAILDPKGVLIVEQAWQGALQAVSEHPGVKVIAERWQPHTREHAVATMEQYLTRFGPGEIDGVMAFGSTVGMGAMYAIQQAGRADEIRVSTCDNTPDVIEALLQGELDGSIGAHWLNGGFGLIMLYDYLNGHEPLEPFTVLEMIEITPDTAAQYHQLFNEHLPFTPEEIRALSLTYNASANLPETIRNMRETWLQRWEQRFGDPGR